MKVYLVILNHGAVATKENERTILVDANSSQEAYNKSKLELMNFGINGWEYVVEIVEA